MIADNKNNKQYALKVFRNPKIALAQGHGMLMEANRMAYFQKNIKEDNWTQFYFAGVKDGFILSEFLDAENLRRPKSTANLNHWGLVGHDDADNRIGGIRFDYGGVQVVNSYLNTNASARQKFGRLMISTDVKGGVQKLIEKYKQSPDKETASLLLAVFTDSRTKDKALKNNILETLLDSPDKERITQLLEAGRIKDVYKLIEGNPTPEQQLLLAMHLQYLDEAEKLPMFKKLAQSADEEVKIALSCSMGSFSDDEEILEAFEMLSKNPSSDLKLFLVAALDYLETEEQIPHFKKLLKDADHDTMMIMAERLWSFNWEDDKKEAYELLLKKAHKNDDGELMSFLKRIKVK